MTNKEKSFLTQLVKSGLKKDETEENIIKICKQYGYCKSTIIKYITIFSNKKQERMTKHQLRLELHKIFPEWQPISLPFQKVEKLFEQYYKSNGTI